MEEEDEVYVRGEHLPTRPLGRVLTCEHLLAGEDLLDEPLVMPLGQGEHDPVTHAGQRLRPLDERDRMLGTEGAFRTADEGEPAVKAYHTSERPRCRRGVGFAIVIEQRLLAPTRAEGFEIDVWHRIGHDVLLSLDRGKHAARYHPQQGP